MSFDSPIYIVFLALVCLVYWRLRYRPQNLLLLLASYFFYGWWDWRFLALMIGSTTLDFLLAYAIDTAATQPVRKRFMLTSVAVNLAVLGVFKYSNFFVDSFLHVAAAAGLAGLPRIFWSIVLPPAISFYTFQEIAYIVDVYERRVPRATNYLDYALFVGLFPHLIAGPIQQPAHLLPQIQAPRVWNPGKAFGGMLLVLEGLVRKSVIADNCGLIANAPGELEPSLFRDGFHLSERGAMVFTPRLLEALEAAGRAEAPTTPTPPAQRVPPAVPYNPDSHSRNGQ